VEAAEWQIDNPTFRMRHHKTCCCEVVLKLVWNNNAV
jgi:predicted  nucleic acid-binding Zn ribbon protein